MKPPETSHKRYKTDAGFTTTMRIQMSNAVSAVTRASKALQDIKDEDVRLAAERRFNEGLDAIRQYYRS